MGTIDGECLFVLALRGLQVPLAEKNVCDMADGMGLYQWFLLLAEKLHGNLIVFEGCSDVVAVLLDLAQSRVGLR